MSHTARQLACAAAAAAVALFASSRAHAQPTRPVTARDAPEHGPAERAQRFARYLRPSLLVAAGTGATILAYPLAVISGGIVYDSIRRGTSVTPGRDGAFATLLLVPIAGPLLCQLVWPQPDVVAATFAIDAAVQLAGATLLALGIADSLAADREFRRHSAQRALRAWTVAPFASGAARGLAFALAIE